jgi:hypothetical protein
MAENWMAVKAATDKQQLAGAIAARIREAGHTILECYGSAAVTTAIQVGWVGWVCLQARRWTGLGQGQPACLPALCARIGWQVPWQLCRCRGTPGVLAALAPSARPQPARLPRYQSSPDLRQPLF